ncbi:hypothetical protein BO94DRAFT_543373 [Aspergillus sclerotioniger CBS 115572]|uniref:RING-type domain-containing protein n=1 Tax=Aspergillus sclerotioniger CBS 115572 TaxID=1450535 RepID=A0A317XC59_9EURO|nr:hypothetical protein BO94DRAFT_543373 [Aspergillus sclerotioniger CBS 115572]PWY94120.1 hypothetical protein BO94DRAFT_543373 [Aspergillus sclerotioniger CBS 115572]
MSPRYSYSHLSDILKLYPDDEPHCVGHAPSQKRRCLAPTNARSRNEARRLIDQGTSMIQAGQCIDSLLYDLAPLVLCTRWHQGQACNLANSWISQVSGYMTGQNTTRQSSLLYNSWQSTQTYTPWQPQLQFPPQLQSPLQPQPPPAYVDTNATGRISELTRKVQAAEKEVKRARKREERAKREAERIRQDTQSLVRRSVAMGFARGQEEAGRNASGVHAAAMTGQVHELRRGDLVSPRREGTRGRGVDITPRIGTTTTINGDSQTNATNNQQSQRAANAASVSDASNNRSGPSTPTSTEQRAVNATSVSNSADTYRASNTSATSLSTEQPTVSSNSVSSTVDTNTTSAPATPSPTTDRRAVNPNSSTTSTTSPSSTSNSSNTEVSTPNPTTPSTPQDTPSQPEPALIIQTQPTLTPAPSLTPPPTPPPTITTHGITRQPIDGECCICILPLLEDPNPNHNHNTNTNTNNLVWCQKQCGVNIHSSCMNDWLASSLGRNLDPTCPICRTRW